jgi:hypothetical protein
MPSLSEILHGKYLEDEDGYQIDAGDGGGLVGALNEKARQQVTIPSEEAYRQYQQWEAGAPSGPPYAYAGTPLDKTCAGTSSGGPYVPGYNEYIGYSDVEDCSEPGCFGDWKYTSWLGTRVCSTKGKWSGGRCAKLDETFAKQAELRKSFYDGELKPFYENVYSAGGFTQYAYNPFPLANREATLRLDEAIKDSCQSIMQGTIKRMLEASYIAGYLAVAPMVIKDIADTYAFYAQRFINNFKPYNPPPPPPPGDGLS